jgi:hypothetical protein
MGAFVRSLTAAFVLSLSVSAAAYATDRPIDGQRLVLKQVGGGTKLIFVSRDPIFLFPAIGGVDDPATVGATIDLFSQSEGQASLAVPGGAGDPGWTASSGPTPSHRFRNGDAPGRISAVRVAVLREGKVLKLVAKNAGLPLAVAQGAVGIRITTGTLRSCARFTGSAIRKDVGGAFIGSHAAVGGLSDCSDDSLNGLPSPCAASQSPACNAPCPGDGVCLPTLNGCTCVSANSPCGDTEPACNGTCPSGEACAAVGPGLFPQCVCLPEGSTPCGDPGAPVCGGACPSGTSCKPVRSAPIFGGTLGCDCAPPGPCGQGGADCPNGFACSPLNPSAICSPIECGGSPAYPTCGGTCVTGAACQPFKLDASGFTACVCAIPAPCDASCGGYACAGGEVCTVQTSPSSCSCGAP